jgi:hypothetical protein
LCEQKQPPKQQQLNTHEDVFNPFKADSIDPNPCEGTVFIRLTCAHLIFLGCFRVEGDFNRWSHLFPAAIRDTNEPFGSCAAWAQNFFTKI